MSAYHCSPRARLMPSLTLPWPSFAARSKLAASRYTLTRRPPSISAGRPSSAASAPSFFGADFLTLGIGPLFHGLSNIRLRKRFNDTEFLKTRFAAIAFNHTQFDVGIAIKLQGDDAETRRPTVHVVRGQGGFLSHVAGFSDFARSDFVHGVAPVWLCAAMTSLYTHEIGTQALCEYISNLFWRRA